MNANHYILSLTGNSYFKVQLPDSSFAYCLSRNFEVNSNGLLVTEQNYPLYEEIQLQDPYTNTLKFSEAGLVSEFISPNWSVIGQVTATLFISPHKLTNLGNGYFAANFQSGEPQTANPGSAGPFENIKLYSRSVIDVPLFYPHVVIKVPVNNYRDILALAHTIISMMTISIAIFDSPDPALSVIQTQADLLETLIADVEGVDHSKIGLRNEAAVNLYLLLQKEIIYVNQVGNGDSGILALSG
ncbi:MAG: hypothetical protein KA792_09905, partial [Bacteroidales bacterium]|nr:hypothetical protein [Bacteroidales bacterium]